MTPRKRKRLRRRRQRQRDADRRLRELTSGCDGRMAAMASAGALTAKCLVEMGDALRKTAVSLQCTFPRIYPRVPNQ